ncbi:uncharacterized protein LOC131859901 [Cryptomeria japonica]|uniref:uncharacterized protein LOC131859901 n=1 Tax=Cryptomeria japonica TaxID=3369 RepID=UPI0027D9DF02|nr:uncharacterized protein LOC131859901 [Cryptomeria japonica]
MLYCGETITKESDETVWAKAEYAEGFGGVCIGSVGEISLGGSFALLSGPCGVLSITDPAKPIPEFEDNRTPRQRRRRLGRGVSGGFGGGGGGGGFGGGGVGGGCGGGDARAGGRDVGGGEGGDETMEMGQGAVGSGEELMEMGQGVVGGGEGNL